jgi:hypothetical protein
MSGEWTGGAANLTWHRGHQLDGTEAGEVRRVLSVFRAEHGWQPGMEWNPYRGAYEYPGKDEEVAWVKAMWAKWDD